MATKIPAAQNRLFKKVFVCKRCGRKRRSDSRKIVEKIAKCRRCNSKAFRPINRK